MKRILSITLGVIVLAVIYAVLFMVGTSLTTPPELAEKMPAEAGMQAASMIPFVALLMTSTIAYLALRSRWHGLKLAAALFVIFFGVNTFLAQIEPRAFPAVTEQMPPGTIPGFFLAGLILALPFSLLAVWLLGKMKKDPISDESNTRLQMSASEWAWKLSAAVILYEVVYFTFGYYVAWRTPGLPKFYGGTDPGTFFGQLANVVRETPWLFLFQLFRALVWTGIGCVIIRMHRGGGFETSFAVGLAFSILMTATMLLPNPLMPPDVYRAHAIELVSSNFVFWDLADRVVDVANVEQRNNAHLAEPFIWFRWLKKWKSRIHRLDSEVLLQEDISKVELSESLEYFRTFAKDRINIITYRKEYKQ